MFACSLNQDAVTEERLARVYKLPVSTYVDLYNEISGAWWCIKGRCTSGGDGHRVVGHHRLEYRVLMAQGLLGMLLTVLGLCFGPG
jgi:hypothetical protein